MLTPETTAALAANWRDPSNCHNCHPFLCARHQAEHDAKPQLETPTATLLSESTETRYVVESQAVGEAPEWYSSGAYKDLDGAQAYVKEYAPRYSSSRKWRIVEHVKTSRKTVL